MKRTCICTKEEPLHKQISPKESLQIEELEVKGYLDEEDYELLTEMSGVKGCLKHLDLSGVTESFPGPDDWRFFFIGNEDLAIYPDSFVNSVRLEEIVFPYNLKGIGCDSFINCENLVIDELPETLKSIGECAFQNCPKLKTVFVSNELDDNGNGFHFGGQFSGQEFAGSGALRSEEESVGGFGREIISVSYINGEGKVESRPIVLYRPADASGDLPLVYVPHYPIDENDAAFKEYMARGWAAASPTEFKPEYNGRLADDNLVFNNAALYTLRRRDGIDRQRIAVVGGSAGGYTALMLCELQMGVCAAVAHSPVANLYYNFAVYFLKCDELNAGAGDGGLPVPVQGMISSTFRPINDFFSGADDPRWEALSPVALIQCLSSPVVVNHYTADVTTTARFPTVSRSVWASAIRAY